LLPSRLRLCKPRQEKPRISIQATSLPHTHQTASVRTIRSLVLNFVFLLQRSFLIVLTISLISVSTVVASVFGQQGKPAPAPSPSPARTPPLREPDQDSVKVFTEEVRLPVIAVDSYGHYDPTLVPDDVLVLEDGIAQQVRSVRHIPANVLFILDTGGELSGLGGLSKSTNLTKAVAMDLVGKLQDGAQIEILQSNNSVDIVQPWTTDKQLVLKKLKSKLSSGKRSRLSDAIVAAAQQLKDRPEGSRHVVMITDGVDSPGGKIDRAEAIKRLIAARATVHIISYTELVRQKSDKSTTSVTTGQSPAGNNPITATDPTLPQGTTRMPSYGVSIRFDPAMRRQRKAYEADIKKSQQVLTNIAEETGGNILLPVSGEEMMAKTGEVARAIVAEYVVTYRPKRPLADASPGEYRAVQVSSRRVGLSLHSRRGYVVPSQD
jgi:VWFA-related protein